MVGSHDFCVASANYDCITITCDCRLQQTAVMSTKWNTAQHKQCKIRKQGYAHKVQNVSFVNDFINHVVHHLVLTSTSSVFSNSVSLSLTCKCCSKVFNVLSIDASVCTNVLSCPLCNCKLLGAKLFFALHFCTTNGSVETPGEGIGYVELAKITSFYMRATLFNSNVWDVC